MYSGLSTIETAFNKLDGIFSLMEDQTTTLRACVEKKDLFFSSLRGCVIRFVAIETYGMINCWLYPIDVLRRLVLPPLVTPPWK